MMPQSSGIRRVGLSGALHEEYSQQLIGESYQGQTQHNEQGTQHPQP